jgi:hypothetical protein
MKTKSNMCAYGMAIELMLVVLEWISNCIMLKEGIN